MKLSSFILKILMKRSSLALTYYPNNNHCKNQNEFKFHVLTLTGLYDIS